MAFCGGLSNSLLMMNMVDDPNSCLGFRFLFLANCLSHSLFINFGRKFDLGWERHATQNEEKNY